MSGAPAGRKGDNKRLYVHPRARNPEETTASSKPEASTSKSKGGRGEGKNEEQSSKVANNKKVSSANLHWDRGSRTAYKNSRPQPYVYKPAHSRRDNKDSSSRENKLDHSKLREQSKSPEQTWKDIDEAMKEASAC